MKSLHLLKTSDGARWAAQQAAELLKCGVEVHAVLPRAEGARLADWRESGACLHYLDLDIRPATIAGFPGRARDLRRLVDRIGPDVIHSHFVATTLAARYALGRSHPVPRLFQVAGPLHLEHAPFRMAELRSAGPRDAWIASSNCIRDLYRRAGVREHRLHLSYYGFRVSDFDRGDGRAWRRTIGVPEGARVIGNISFIYPPKRLLGQREGLKGHELLLEVLDRVCRRHEDVWGVLAGGTFGGGTGYERSLKRRATRLGGGRILMPGPVSAGAVGEAWRAFDCVVHLPRSENCGGVVEPLAAGVPVVAAAVGGIPEVIVEGVTGRLVRGRDPVDIARVVEEMLEAPAPHRAMAARGAQLVRTMFDVTRTAREVGDIYRAVVEPGAARPEDFSPTEFLAHVQGD